MEVGLKIGQYLKERGIKQSFIGEKAGLSADVMSAICTGERKSIDCVVYFRICRALGVDLMTFLPDDDDEVAS